MHRGHAILAALVAAAALWAYFVAHPPGGGAPGGQSAVRVWQVPAREVRALRFRDGATLTVLTPQWEAGAEQPFVWVQSELPGRKPPPPPQDARDKPAARDKARSKAGTPEPAPPDASAPEPERSAFKGNATALQTLEFFAALTAARDLGRLDALDASQLGLPGQAATLELERRDAPPLRLELGRATYGETGRYAHNPGDGRVYLLRAPELRRLASVRGSLMDRDLLGLKPEEVARIELRAGAASRTLHRLAEPNQWGAAADAGDAVPDAAALMTALHSLKALRYGAADGGDAEPGGSPALEVRLFRAGGAEPAAWLRLFAEEGPTLTAVSSYTRRPVQLVRPAVAPLLEKARALLRGT